LIILTRSGKIVNPFFNFFIIFKQNFSFLRDLVLALARSGLFKFRIKAAAALQSFASNLLNVYFHLAPFEFFNKKRLPPKETASLQN